MFQRITIELDGPICKCTMQDLAWAIIVVKDGDVPKHTLAVSCKACKQELRVAPSEFKAGFKLDVAYPETEKPTTTKDGNLIDASEKFQMK